MSSQAILLVDDERAIVDAVRAQLRRRFGGEFVYETAGCADEAWEVIDELVAERIELLLIISDWLMPGLRGDEFLIQLHKKLPRVVKVMLTGQCDERSIERARREANLHRCLFKPWSETELIETIESGIRGEAPGA